MRGLRYRLPWLVALPLSVGCYGSHGEEGDGAADATAEDSAADETTNPDDAGIEDAAVEAEMDEGIDFGSDSTVECPPLVDGRWVDFTIDGSTFEAVDVETPCRMSIVIGGPPGHDVVELVCGTGARMTTYTVDFYANPPVSPTYWDGAEVTLRYVADPVWWIDRWFTVRDPSGNLLFGGTNASRLVPPGEDPAAWYAPLDVRIVGGLCPANDSGCGLQERQALDVGYAEGRELIFDGYQAYVGGLATASFHVGTATHHVEMTCDDVPDDWYMLVFVLPPEG
ncbi:MAG: hypothetical protein HY905_12575 [Deltaproteobacteria bacterium]|nr:hypothetical protein [Deltaproteobacteria bacterium]